MTVLGMFWNISVYYNLLGFYIIALYALGPLTWTLVMDFGIIEERGCYSLSEGQKILLNHKYSLRFSIGIIDRIRRRLWCAKRKRMPRSAKHAPSEFAKTFANNIPKAQRKDGVFTSADATRYVEQIAGQAKRATFWRQMSPADQKAGRVGDRDYHWSIDVEADERHDCYYSDMVDVFIGVDYYVNMPEFLLTCNRDVILYTMTPTALTRGGSRNPFTIQNDEVVMNCGNTVYRHMLWDYESNTLTVTWNDKGKTIYSRLYRVMRHRVGPDHSMVCLSLLADWYGRRISPDIYTRHNYMKRRAFTKSGYNTMTSVTELGPIFSVTENGGWNQASVPTAQYEMLRILATKLKHGLTLPQVEQVLKERQPATVLYAYLTDGVNHVPCLIPTTDAVLRYQFDDEHDASAKPSLTAFMSPVANGAFAPDQTQANEAKAVQGRITEPIAEAKVLVANADIPGTMLDLYIGEFVDMVKPLVPLVPVTLDEVTEKQCKPTQRNILEQSVGMDAKRKVEMFIKKESYGKAGDPRIISTINGVDKRDYSMYTYAMADHMHAFNWYAFGLKPVTIAERVASICAGAGFVISTDFSRFDGHVTNELRKFEDSVMFASFDARYHDELKMLLDSQRALPGRGPKGTKYDTASTRLSGSPETSLFNTLDNAFIAYVALRQTNDSKRAWIKLGLYGGDDGLTADVDPSVYVRAASAVGQKLTSEVTKHGDFGVKFLARMYSPMVWHGCLDSCCDLPRQINKFHTTSNLPAGYTQEMKLFEKARSFLVNDSNTPLLGPLCKRAMSFCPKDFKADATLRNAVTQWTTRVFEDDGELGRYPNEYGHWMHHYAASSLPSFDAKLLETSLANAKSVKDLLRLPCCQPTAAVNTTVPVHVNGVLHRPTEPLPEKAIKPSALKRPPTAPKKKESFAELRARKIKSGTWVEKPKVPAARK